MAKMNVKYEKSRMLRFIDKDFQLHEEYENGKPLETIFREFVSGDVVMEEGYKNA